MNQGRSEDFGRKGGIALMSLRKQMGREGVRNGKSSGFHMLMRRNLNGGQDLVRFVGFWF